MNNAVMQRLKNILLVGGATVSQKMSNVFGVVAIGLLFGLSIQFAKAWTNPAAIPPNGNLAGPITTGVTAQTKAGALTISGGGTVGTGGLAIGNQSFNSIGATWLYMGNNVFTPYAGTGLATDYLWANTIAYVRNLQDPDGDSTYVLDPNESSKLNYALFTSSIDVNGYIQAFTRVISPQFCIGASCINAWPSLTENDTLQTVTDRGAITTRNITVNSLRGSGQPAFPRWNGGASVYVLESSYLYNTNATGAMYLGEANPVLVRGDIRAPVFYDLDNTGYLVDPNSTSRMNYGDYDNLYSRGWMQSQIFYDANDPSNFYVDPASTSVLNAVYASTFYYNSDQSLKDNIQTVPDALENVTRLHGVSFNWKSDGTPSFGVVAQEVEKVYPELVSTDKKTGLKSVEYGNLIGPVIEAIKELNKKIEGILASTGILNSQMSDQKTELENQRAEIRKQQEAIEILQQEIEALKTGKN